MSADALDTKLTIPVSAVMATKDRAHMVRRTVRNIAEQSYLPAELIIIDASSDDSTKRVVEEDLRDVSFKMVYIKAAMPGAATQRMQGVEIASQHTIWFLDDDILLEAECTRRIWDGFFVHENVGAVGSMITNQRYTPPGRLTRFMYRLMHGEKLRTYAGKVIGPAWNLLPEDERGMPDYVPCEWLNTTCTMYKRNRLPNPVFSDHFHGYSLMEDVTLSLLMASSSTLLNARTARIFHDSQPGSHKNSRIRISQMQLVNRHYVMTRILNRSSFKDYMKLVIFEFFGITTSMWDIKNVLFLPSVVIGKIIGIYKIITS